VKAAAYNIIVAEYTVKVKT